VDDFVYKRRPVHVNEHPGVKTDFPGAQAQSESPMPSFEQLQQKQRTELLEMAQVRYGIKGSKVEVRLTPLTIHLAMTEAQIFKTLMAAPEHERADQVLFALAKGDMEAAMANQILAGLALLGKFKSLKIPSGS